MHFVLNYLILRSSLFSSTVAGWNPAVFFFLAFLTLMPRSVLQSWFHSQGSSLKKINLIEIIKKFGK